MNYDPDIHHRRSIRLQDYDYSAGGAYFVTLCVQGRECLFGEIRDGVMVLSTAGIMVQDVWTGMTERFCQVHLDEFIIMPNHLHGIVCLVGAPLAAPGFESRSENKGAASGAPTLGNIVRAFKSISAIEINRVLDRQGRPLWQRNYYERVIRDDTELAGIREYIADNPARWADDEENPDVV